MSLCRSLILVLCTAALAAAQERPMSLPIHVTAEVAAAEIATTGRALLKLQFRAETTPKRAYAVRVEVRRAKRVVVRRDHAPPVPTREWTKDKPIAYELPLALPLDETLREGDELEVFLGFLDAAGDKVSPPLSRSVGADGLARVASFELPAFAVRTDAAAVDAAIASATARAAADPHGAWDELDFTFRRVEDYALKTKLQKVLLTIGRTPPRALTFEERDIVQRRVGAERGRYLRLVAGRMYDAGKRLGALMLLDAVGGELQEQADRAVLGALADATRHTQDRDAIVAKVFALTPEQDADFQALKTRHADPEERLALGVKMGKDPAQRAVGRMLVRSLEYTDLRERAAEAAKTLEAAWLADVPPAERAEAKAAMDHPSWARTRERVSHRFVLIGPETLLAGIPDDSLLRLDVAYLYVTDLFGRVPNPDGDRVTVYWKELWDFGGGVGGGKTIDIGNADAQQKGVRVDNGLLYHELTHCVDDTWPIYDGFREGLADFGAAFAHAELGQIAAARLAVGAAARAFQQDYLDRDLEYWRIPNYSPSAGFLLHFVTKGKTDGYHWERYRRFFRGYRKCRVKDTRTPSIARAFAFHLVEAFGKEAFADLQRFRWPLLDEDLEAVRREQAAAERGASTAPLDEAPGSPVPRDVAARRLFDERAGLDEWRERLGVVRDWWVIGPFRRDGVDPGAFRFAPEREVDLAARYESFHNNPTWRRPGEKPVTVGPNGWLTFDFPYMDDTAIYALTHVTVERDTEAWLHVRADDDLTVFLNDELVGSHDFRDGPGGPWRPREGYLPDLVRFPATLRTGRNKLLLKVRNRGGGSGCSLAVAQRNGMPLPGWTTDVEPAARKLANIELPDPRRWGWKLRLRFESAGEQQKLDDTVGKWRVRNGALEGFATDRQVEWRKYTVRPGFPKDSPSNLAWLSERTTEGVDAFQLAVDLAPGPAPKLCVVFQGDGQRDALSGWTLLLEPLGDKVRAHLERYDRLVYQSEPVEWKSDTRDAVRLELLFASKRLVAKLGDAVLFDQAPLQPIPGRHRIGFATWNEALRIEAVELRAPAKSR